VSTIINKLARLSRARKAWLVVIAVSVIAFIRVSGRENLLDNEGTAGSGGKTTELSQRQAPQVHSAVEAGIPSLFDTAPDRQSAVSPTLVQDNRSLAAKPAPLSGADESTQLIRDFMSAWSGKQLEEMERVWQQITQCHDCLLAIRDLMMNQGVPKGMLLELSYRIIELGDPMMLPVFDTLISGAVEKNVAAVVVLQLVKNGSDAHIRQLMRSLQNLAVSGAAPLASQLNWTLTKLKNPKGIAPIMDALVQTGAATEFNEQLHTVLKNMVAGMGYDEEMALEIVDYYGRSDPQAKDRLKDIVYQNPAVLAGLASRAYSDGFHSEFQQYAKAIAQVNNVSAVDGLMKLQKQVAYSPEYFVELMHGLIENKSNSENLRRLEDYLRNTDSDLNTKIIAAEGLLAVQQNREAGYILEKVINSSSYDDTEIVTYIHSRLN